MWTGGATSCSNTVRRHVAATNRFMCTGEFLWKSLSPQRNFVTATSHKKSNQTESVQLVAATKFCCSNKDVHKNSPVHTKPFVTETCRLTVLLQLVAQCVLTFKQESMYGLFCAPGRKRVAAVERWPLAEVWLYAWHFEYVWILNSEPTDLEIPCY